MTECYVKEEFEKLVNEATAKKAENAVNLRLWEDKLKKAFEGISIPVFNFHLKRSLFSKLFSKTKTVLMPIKVEIVSVEEACWSAPDVLEVIKISIGGDVWEEHFFTQHLIKYDNNVEVVIDANKFGLYSYDVDHSLKDSVKHEDRANFDKVAKALITSIFNDFKKELGFENPNS
jgi:hypothetical protein